MFSTVVRQRAEGLESLSARERAEGCTGNDRGPMESSAASTSVGNHKLGRSKVSSAFTEKSTTLNGHVDRIKVQEKEKHN